MFEGLIYQFVYNLERHRLFNMAMRRWLILLCLVLPVTAWLKVWGASRLTAVLITLGAVVVLVATWWAGGRRYVRFDNHVDDQISIDPPGGARTRGATSQGPPESPVPAMSKVGVRATGYFEVSGMRRYLVETPTDYTTFDTREHCLMTQVPHSRFLLLGKSREEEVGWWYTFFQPSMVRGVTNGWLYFGLRPRLALRLEIAQPDDPEDEILYLSFDDEATRSLVLADLQFDERGPH